MCPVAPYGMPGNWANSFEGNSLSIFNSSIFTLNGIKHIRPISLVKRHYRGCRWRDSNPHRVFTLTDFKSVASAISPHRPCLAKNTQERPLRPKSFFALAEVLEASVRPQPPSRERRLCLSRRRQVLKNFASSVADPLGEKRYAKLRPHRHKVQRQERSASRRDV